MISPARHRLSILVLLCYIAGSVLIETTHHDDASILLRSQPVLEQHACGANEIHIDPGHAQQCLACSQSAQRHAIEVHDVSIAGLSLVALSLFPSQTEHALVTDIYHTGKRGPPPPTV